MAYSMDIRRKVIAALERSESQASVARRFEINQRTVQRYRQRQQTTGDVNPMKTGPQRPMKLTEADEQLMRDTVAQRPGITAMQLIPMLSVSVVESTVCRALKRLGLSLKKNR